MKKTITGMFLAALALSLAGCGNRPVQSPAPAAEPQVTAAAPAPAETAAPIEPEGARHDGERFEAIILLEGMEETVLYEHIANQALGFEMDYDYENFVRRSQPDRERFVSVWDDPEDPENYLEVRYSPLDAEAAAAAISEALSGDYEIRRDDPFSLDGAGRCIRIAADEVKGGGHTPDHLCTVYIIPAADGCRVAAAHCAAAESEGFLHRFRYMMNTFSPVADPAAFSVPGIWQTASMGYADGDTIQPAYYVRFSDSDILYGHLKAGQFVLDHSDKIVSLGAAPAGGVRVQAEASNGIRYTYQTSESDEDVLEYYETWQEGEFSEMYRGGASLSRCMH